ncbi:anti-anti-sigma factor [Saccharothrix tamanrassetensis]|uniref:Anti-sigma factor antagonist n=1 Tax=Saccharothrix tamanrassetensis TaxID=1051531 RepID=A0A841CNP3_9PSEU|nr:STAS domain-containing protein [Saccharothrix tamanrassetensis]MBB5957984.1 anti-anti-sigma factor [Saccharothrix tamanrassetensis]
MTERTTRPAAGTRLEHGISLIRVSGALDSGSQQAVTAELDTAFDTHPDSIVLDLRDVDFLGSAGIGLLVNARHRAARLDVPFAVVADNRSVLRPLRVSQVDGALPLHPTLEDALAAVRLAAT